MCLIYKKKINKKIFTTHLQLSSLESRKKIRCTNKQIFRLLDIAKIVIL